MTARHNMHCKKMTSFVDGKCDCFDTFDQFLQSEFMGSGFADGITKDDFEDAYINWVGNLDSEDFTEYGDAYGDYRANLAQV